MIKEVKETLKSFQPSKRQLRLFGIALGIILGAVGFYVENLLFRRSAFAAAGAAFLLSLLLPRLLFYVSLALMALTFPLGWMVSRILLIGFFYLVITPASLLLALFNKDILKLKRKKENTYWEEFEENRNPDTMGL